MQFTPSQKKKKANKQNTHVSKIRYLQLRLSQFFFFFYVTIQHKAQPVHAFVFPIAAAVWKCDQRLIQQWIFSSTRGLG